MTVNSESVFDGERRAAFKPYKLEQYKLHDGLAGIVKTSWEGVYGALYSSPEQAIVVISNTSPVRRKNVVWRLEPGSAEIGNWSRLTLKDVKLAQTQEFPASALADGTMLLSELDGYEYRLYEIQPVQ